MLRIVLSLVAIYVLFVALLVGCQRKVLYHPDVARPAPSQFGVAQMQVVALHTSDNLDLVAWWQPPRRDHAPVLVFFHGNAGHIGFRGAKIQPYLNAGWGVLLTSYRGYSGNPGSPTEQGLYMDARAALAFLVQNDIPVEDIVLYGESLGSGVAVQMAFETGQAFRALVLEAPYTSITEIAARRFPFVPTKWLLRDKFDSKSKISSIHLPLIVIHGERDGVISVEIGRALFDAANSPKIGKFFPDAGHNNLYDFGAAKLIIESIDEIQNKLK